MNPESLFYIQTERTFTKIRKYAWVFTLAVAFGGLWYPRLGLLVLPVILALTITGFFKGRYWCGNFCPHGSLFDQLLLPLSRNQKIPDFLKSPYFRGFIFIFFIFSIGRRVTEAMQVYGQSPFLDKLGFVFVLSYLVVTILGGTLAVLISPRAWCQFCPMGTLQILSHKLGTALNLNNQTEEKVTALTEDMCHECGTCARVCPMQLFPYQEFSKKGQLDNELCIRCATCVHNCPANILELNTEPEARELIPRVNLEGYQNKQVVTAVIEKITEINSNVREFTFKLQQPPSITIKPGQFMLIKINEELDMYRAYSVAGIGDNGHKLQLTIMKVDQGYGTTIIFNEFAEGQQVELKGPMGRELVVDKQARNILLVAGGIGIAPFLPIVQDLLKKDNPPANLELIYGVNHEQEFIYRQKFAELAADSDQFTFTPVVAFDEDWSGEKGFVTDVMSKRDLQEYKIYMCGPEAMEAAAQNLLNEKQVPEENIFVEST